MRAKLAQFRIKASCRCFPLLIAYFLLPVAYSQELPLYFENLSTEKGLSHAKVNCITQDSRGFIWIGTEDGLNRYDGYNFEVFHYQPGIPGSISGNKIADLLEDEDGVLWIATRDGGLSRYDHRLPPEEQFKAYRHIPDDPASIPTNSLNKLAEDDRGYLWLATNGTSALRFDKRSETFARPAKTERRVALSLTKAPDGDIWVGRQGGSIMTIDPETLAYDTDPHYDDLYADLPHPEISSLYTDQNGDIWFGSWDKGLYRYISDEQREVAVETGDEDGSFTPDQILSFAEDKQGRLWMGGATEGLQVYDPSTGRFHHYSHDPLRRGALSGNRVNCIFPDRGGNMWLGTDRGLSIVIPSMQQFQQTFLPANRYGQKPSVIYDIYEDREKTLWVGTDIGLYFRREGEDKFIYRRLLHKWRQLAVSSFFEDGEHFYLGTSYSLFRYHPDIHWLSILPNTHRDQVMDGLIESRITSIVKTEMDGNPSLLVTPYGHYMAWYDLEEKRWVSRQDEERDIISHFGLEDHLIRKFYKTASGDIWMPHTNGGLGVWEKPHSSRVSYYTAPPPGAEGLHTNNVYDVAEGGDSLLWISTYGGGLHRMNLRTRKIRHIAGSPNLSEGITVDDNGFVYMVSGGQLHRYDPGQRLFSSAKLPDSRNSGGVSGYIHKDRSETMYVSGPDYFVAFTPDDFPEKSPAGRPVITDFRIFNTSHNHLLGEKSIRLPHRENTVSFQFAAPDFSFSTPPRFAYRLKGVDEDWTQHDGQSASYANLRGGNYIFQVKLTDHTGAENGMAQLHFTVVPPYWLRWWFFLLCALVIAAIAWGVHHYRVNELLKRQAIRNQIAQDLHDEMGSALSSISVYSKVAQEYGKKHQESALQKTLQRIGDTSGKVVSDMSDIVWAINPRNDSMEKLFQRMDTFARPLATANDINFELKYAPEVINLEPDMKKRKNFFLIFKEAVNNAVKYAEAKNLTVKVTRERSNIVLTVEDDGKGFDLTLHQVDKKTDTLGGNGLYNMMARAHEIDGNCHIWSESGKGTRVELNMPTF